MSMLCTLSRVTEEQMKAMRGNPSIVDELLHESISTAQAKPSFVTRIFGKTMPPPAMRTLPWIGIEHQYDLDGQWHILQFLLTGEVEGGSFPACFLCGAGEEVGSDLGYGPPRLFTSEQTSLIAEHLLSIKESDLLVRYKADEIEAQDVYWQAAGSPDEQREQVHGLWETLVEVARFTDETAKRTCGLVVEIY